MRELEIFPVFYSCLFVKLHAYLGEQVIWFVPVFFISVLVYALSSLFWNEPYWKDSMRWIFLSMVFVVMISLVFSYSFFLIYGLAVGTGLFFLGLLCLSLAMAWGKYCPCYLRVL